MALNEYLRLQKLRQLAGLAGTVELRYSNDELEALEEPVLRMFPKAQLSPSASDSHCK